MKSSLKKPSSTKSKQQRGNQQKQEQSTPKSPFDQAVELHTSLVSYLNLILTTIQQSDCEIDLVVDFKGEMEYLSNQFNDQLINDLYNEGHKKADFVIEDLYSLNGIIQEMIPEFQKLKKDKTAFKTFVKLYTRKLQQVLKQLTLTSDQPQNQKVEEIPNNFQEEQQKFKEAPPQDDNPFCFNQISNFNPQEIYVAPPLTDELPQQQVKQQQPQTQIQPSQQAEQIPSVKEPEIVKSSQDLGEQQIKIQKQQEPQMQFGFDKFPQTEQKQQKTHTEESQQSEKQAQFNWDAGNAWGVENQQQQPQDQGWEMPQENKFEENQWEVKKIENNADWNSQQWGMQKEEPNDVQQQEQQMQWGKVDQVMDIENEKEKELKKQNEKEKEKEKEREILSDKDSQTEKQDTKKVETNPFQRSQSQSEWGANNNSLPTPANWKEDEIQKENEDFQGFSKVFNNQSDYKTDIDSKPFSDIFGFGDPSKYDNETNLQNYESPKLSQKNASLSQESQVEVKRIQRAPTISSQEDIKSPGMPQAQAFDNFTDFQNQFKKKHSIEKDNNEFKQNKFENNQFGNDEFNEGDFQVNKNDFNLDNWNMEFDPKSRKSQKFKSQEDLNYQDQEFPKYYDSSKDIDKFGDNLQKHTLQVLNRRGLDYLYLETIEINNIQDKVDASIQAETNQVALRYNPYQEIEHQNERKELMKKIEQLEESKQGLEIQITELEQQNQQLNEDFNNYKQFENRFTSAYKQISQQYQQISESYRQMKSSHQLQEEEIEKLQQENINLSESLTKCIKQLADVQLSEESLINKLKTLQNQFEAIRFDHKCPIQQYVKYFFKNPLQDQSQSIIPNLSRPTVAPKPQLKQILQYDSSLFINILRECAKPYSNQIDDFKYAILKDKAILYSDRMLQIGIITRGGQEVYLELHISNKCDHDLTINKIKLICPSNNLVNNPQVHENSVLGKRKAFKIILKYKYIEQMQLPKLEFKANEQQYSILLPITINKFIKSELIDIGTLRQRWKENQSNKLILSAVIEQPNPKFLVQVKDFIKYFPTLSGITSKSLGNSQINEANNYQMLFQIAEYEMAVKFKQKKELMIKIQSGQLLKYEAEQLLQFLLFIFNK